MDDHDAKRAPARELYKKAGREGWAAGRGEVHLAWNEGGHVLLRFEGHGDARLAYVATRCFDALGARTLRLYFDVWDIPTYDSELRVHFTEWILAHRSQLGALHVLLRSKIIAMGVSVANVALGGMAEPHTDLAEFEALLDRTGLASARKLREAAG